MVQFYANGGDWAQEREVIWSWAWERLAMDLEIQLWG